MDFTFHLLHVQWFSGQRSAAITKATQNKATLPLGWSHCRKNDVVVIMNWLTIMQYTQMAMNLVSFTYFFSFLYSRYFDGIHVVLSFTPGILMGSMLFFPLLLVFWWDPCSSFLYSRYFDGIHVVLSFTPGILMGPMLFFPLLQVFWWDPCCSFLYSQYFEGIHVVLSFTPSILMGSMLLIIWVFCVVCFGSFIFISKLAVPLDLLFSLTIIIIQIQI